MAVRSGVNLGLYLFLVLHFLNGAFLFKMVRKALLKNNQASPTDGMRSMSFHDTRARLIRKASSLKCFRERLTVMRGGCLTADPLTDDKNSAYDIGREVKRTTSAQTYRGK